MSLDLGVVTRIQLQSKLYNYNRNFKLLIFEEDYFKQPPKEGKANNVS